LHPYIRQAAAFQHHHAHYLDKVGYQVKIQLNLRGIVPLQIFSKFDRNKRNVMAVALNQHTELNPVQVSLLRLFNRPMSEKEALEIRNLLVDHYSEILKEEVTKAIEEKGYTPEDLDNLLNAES
jgi:hypothetical protein